MQQRKHRAEQGLFLAEGAKALSEAARVPGCVVEVFATPAAAQAYDEAHGPGTAWSCCDEDALASLADAVTPQGIVALCRTLDADPGVLRGARLVAVCADVRDPGNAGTIVRTADAAGADAIVLAGDTVDPYNAKTVRASVGSLFHLPLVRVADPAEAVTLCRDAGLGVLAAEGAGERDLFAATDLLGAPTAWLFGNEAWGLPEELAALADHRVRIPIHGRAESLNLATAAAVCLYASAQAHRS
ncbi:RNA methyltransferase [Nocardioides mangrovicus]|uniref:RNA methyltransferase n=1 Tax=Nocardioides mangrovicus TaxID=2478913 RepID=A0A3L8P522_9ACTN|nr:RNA methyltransferase [Nocardioides mangrovicus]